MSLTTWNFPTWQPRDQGPGGSRNIDGEGFNTAEALPFNDDITGIFSVFLDSNYVSTDNDVTGQINMVTSIGKQGTTGFQIHGYYQSSGVHLLVVAGWDQATGTQRYQWSIGDEDGTNWIQQDKWYQVAVSMNDTRLQVVVNGSSTYSVNKTVDSPGTLNLNNGSERWWHFGPSAGWGTADPSTVDANWPTHLVGPSAWTNIALDLSVQANIDRIFDSDGNLKNPGENGSLWFNDAYTETAGFHPKVYMLDGTPRVENGSEGFTWGSYDNNGYYGIPGGLRKQYE